MPKISGQSSRLLMIICLGLLFLPACAPIKAAGAPPTLKIGLVAPFEGLYRPLGYETLFGVKLALQEHNQRGGLNGYKIELVALNDFDEPDQAKIQAEALAADPDVVGVVGHLSTAATQAAIPIYQQADLALVIPWTWTTAATESGLDQSGVVSVAATKAETTAKLAQLAQAAGYRQVVTVTAARIDPFARAVEAIFLDTDGITAGEFMLAWQLAGQARPIFGQPDVGSLQLVQVAGPAANGLIYVSPGPADIEADWFRAAYQALAGFPPGRRAVLAYEATNVLLAAIDRALLEGPAPPTRARVRAVINQIQLVGLTGPIAFDGQGRRLNAPLWVYQISNEAYPGTLIGSP